VCDGYELPFRDRAIAHLILFDVFHHLEKPALFLREARRVLAPGGRVILFEPFISYASYPVYGLLHHEPVALRKAIDRTDAPPAPRSYYAAQGNATRLFFRGETPPWPPGWRFRHGEAFAAFAYLFSGGFSKPAMYPAGCLNFLERCDRFLSRWPGAFGARCLIAMEPV
jgi:SAM-dependent methyltransferase